MKACLFQSIQCCVMWIHSTILWKSTEWEIYISMANDALLHFQILSQHFQIVYPSALQSFLSISRLFLSISWLSSFPNKFSVFPNHFSSFPNYFLVILDHFTAFSNHSSAFPDCFSTFPGHLSTFPSHFYSICGVIISALFHISRIFLIVVHHFHIILLNLSQCYLSTHVGTDSCFNNQIKLPTRRQISKTTISTQSGHPKKESLRVTRLVLWHWCHNTVFQSQYIHTKWMPSEANPMGITGWYSSKGCKQMVFQDLYQEQDLSSIRNEWEMRAGIYSKYHTSVLLWTWKFIFTVSRLKYKKWQKLYFKIHILTMWTKIRF